MLTNSLTFRLTVSKRWCCDGLYRDCNSAPGGCTIHHHILGYSRLDCGFVALISTNSYSKSGRYPVGV